MTYSLNEVEALAKKAARGAGMSWGLAEDAGKALRTLLEHGVDAVGPFTRLLTANDGADHAAIAPRAISGPWTAPGGILCPVATGTCLSDHAHDLDPDKETTIGRTAFPVFLIPFALAVARARAQTITLCWQGTTAHALTDGTLRIDGSDAAFLIPETDSIQCRVSATLSGQPTPHMTRANMTDEDAACLSGLAHRTYAPATEESRLSGAGAGLSDND